MYILVVYDHLQLADDLVVSRGGGRVCVCCICRKKIDIYTWHKAKWRISHVSVSLVRQFGKPSGNWEQTLHATGLFKLSNWEQTLHATGLFKLSNWEQTLHTTGLFKLSNWEQTLHTTGLFKLSSQNTKFIYEFSKPKQQKVETAVLY